MKKLIEDSINYICLSDQEANELKVVHGCSGFKYQIGSFFFMKDEPVGGKDRELCLTQELGGNASIFLEAKDIKSLAEIMECPIDFERNEEAKKRYIGRLLIENDTEKINRIYSLLLNACRRYTSANIFEIAKVEVGASRIDRYILFSKIANQFGLSNCVPHVTKCLLKKTDNIIAGCMIEKIDGIDITHWGTFDKTTKDYLIDYQMTDAGYRDITSIHLIDYLTGQVDRNLSNIIYRFNSEGKISGCIAIDNDVCLGCSTIDDLASTRLGNAEKIVCIDKELLNKFNEIDNNILNKLLVGYLSENEISFFYDRFYKLKEILKNVTPVSSGEWEHYRAVLQEHPYIKRFREGILEMNMEVI